jgi:hypothetical protein
MELAQRGGPITGLAQRRGQQQRALRPALMQLARAGVVRITAGEHAGAARTARTGREPRLVEAHPLAGQAVEVRRADGRMPVGPEIIPRHIVRDEDHDVRPFRGGLLGSRRLGHGHTRGQQREDGAENIHSVIFSVYSVPSTA